MSRILIVEDEPAIMESTARILRLHGYTVLEATTGRAALAMIAVHDVDLLLTDSVMPEMSGRELVARITPQHPRLPVLFMSGYNERKLGPRRVVEDRTAFVESRSRSRPCSAGCAPLSPAINESLLTPCRR